MKQSQNIIYFISPMRISFLMSICIMGITSIILSSSPARVFAEQALYTCYGVTNDLTQSVCTIPNPDTLPAICVLENDPIAITNYFIGEYDILPQSEKYSEIVTGINSPILPTTFPASTPLPNNSEWSYSYSATAPSVTFAENNRLLNLKFEVDTIVPTYQQQGGGGPLQVNTSLIQPIFVEHRFTQPILGQISASVSGNNATINAAASTPDGNNLNIIFEISDDNFVTVLDSFTLSNQPSGNFAHTFNQLNGSNYKYKVKAVNVSNASCTKPGGIEVQSSLKSFSIAPGLCDPIVNTSTAAASTSAITNSSICITPGSISLFPGDSSNNDDVCSNDDIETTISTPSSPATREGVVCNPSENSISLGSINTASVRQNPNSIMHDVLFDDLRGNSLSEYTITAEISNFVDKNNPTNILTLGSNPDGARPILDPGVISSINVTNGGSGYTDSPVIAFSGGGGSGATAVAVVSGGVVTRIDIKSYGSGYTSSPIVVIVPTNGGAGAIATAKIIEVDSNLNPDTSLPEEKVFVTLDPSVGTITKLKPDQATNPANFSTGPRSLITSSATQHTLFKTSSPVSTGRYNLDGTLFGLRTPAYLATGEYRAVITQTLILDAPIASCNTINGTTGNDTTTGTLGPDCIYGYGGDDTLSGSNGNDQIFAGSPTNLIGGSTFIYGDGGDDVITGGSSSLFDIGSSTGFNILNGTNNTLLGVGEHDTIIGGGVGSFNQFNLGSDQGVYYVGGGNADYASIFNFDCNVDIIQLARSSADYIVTYSGNVASVYYLQTNGTQDLIAKINGFSSGLDLNNGCFSYVTT
jgi:RTX calcium-binding nonapeptide repeat (4 copies)